MRRCRCALLRKIRFIGAELIFADDTLSSVALNSPSQAPLEGRHVQQRRRLFVHLFSVHAFTKIAPCPPPLRKLLKGDLARLWGLFAFFHGHVPK